MYNKLNLGQNAAGIFAAPAFSPISKIVVLVDEKNEYVSGDDTGRTLEVTCPYGSQAMADDLLAQLKGYAYQPMTAQDALLDPAAEIGDGVTVGGVYTILAQIDTLFDMHCAADIAAPGEEELESEYTFQTQEKRLERKLAQTRSLISKTAEEIRLEVAGVEDEISYIQLDLESITSRVQDAEGNISTLEQTATSLRSEISGKLDGDEAQSLIDQTLEGIELSVSSSGGSTTFRLTADGVLLSTKTLDLTVDAVNISGTLTAGALRGGTVSLLTSGKEEAGGMDITVASTGTYAIELWSYGALRMEAYDGAAYLGSGDAHVHVEEDATTITNGDVGIELSNHVWIGGNMFPNSPDDYLCGNANFPWSAVWSTNGMCETSDRRKKKNIIYGLDRFDGFFDDLLPGSYQMVNGTSGRRHNGFVSQDVRDNLSKHGISTADFGGYVEDKDKDGNPIYALRYSEFIPLIVEQVQKLKARVARLEAKA